GGGKLGDYVKKLPITTKQTTLRTASQPQRCCILCCYLADRIQELGDILEEQSRQFLMDDLAIGQTAGEENGWIPAEDVRQHFAERI
ncbi:MAG: hypothetical protein KH132_08585, partial [Faecalibacterium prausnitzii]|nr:hypothetical protein [Faecalibacterium prausnitzii]